VSALFSPVPSDWLVRRLAKQLEGLSSSDVRAALARARISLDFPAEEISGTTFARDAGPRARASTGGKRKPAVVYGVSVQDLIGANLIRPPLALTQKYLGQEVTARIETDGRVSFGGQTYKSPSVAAAMARAAVKGAPPPPRKYWQTNGWTFWHYRDEDGQLRELAALRDEFLRTRGP
jgi:hypothetical protein